MKIKSLTLTTLMIMASQTMASNPEEFDNGISRSSIAKNADGTTVITNTVRLPFDCSVLTTNTFPPNAGTPINTTVINQSDNGSEIFGFTSSQARTTQMLNGVVTKDEETQTPLTQIPVQKN